MRKILFLMFFFLIQGCNKPKAVLICGDHICVNKAEARQFFEENLTLEVQVLDNKDSKEVNLVELNLKANSEKNKKISIKQKNKLINKLKNLQKKK